MQHFFPVHQRNAHAAVGCPIDLADPLVTDVVALPLRPLTYMLQLRADALLLHGG